MSDKNNFTNIQRLNSTIMAKCEWTSSLIGMRKTGEEVHHRRTKTHRKANEFLQELFDQRSDGSTFDDNGVTDRYHKFLRSKSNLNDDSHVLDEFDRRLRALNNNRLSKTFKSTDEGLNSIRSQISSDIKDGNLNRYWRSSKSTLDSNILSSIPSNASQMHIRSNAADHRSSSSEESTTMSLNYSTARKIVHELKPQQNDDIEKTEEVITSSTHHVLTQPYVQQDVDQMEESSIVSSRRSSIKNGQKSNIRRMDSSEDAEEFSSSPLNRIIAPTYVQHDKDQMIESSMRSSISSVATSMHESKLQQVDDDDTEELIRPSVHRVVTNTHVQYDESDTSKRSTAKISHKLPIQDANDSEHMEDNSISSVNPSTTRSSHEMTAQRLNGNRSIKESSTPTIKRSIKKPSNIQKINYNEHIKETSKKILPKPQVQQIDTKHENSETSITSSTIPLTTKTLYRPIARRADGSEIVSTVTENPIRDTSSVNSLFNQRFFPRSLLPNESVTTNSTRNTLLSSPPRQQYDNNQLFYLLDGIENECTPVDFTQMLDKLNLSFGQVSELNHDISANNDNYDDDDDDVNEDNIIFMSNLFDESSSSSSQEYFTTFIVNINDPRKISLYTMTISTVQLSPNRIVPYSILNGRRPLLELSKETNFRRFRSRQYKYTYQVIAIESFTNMEHIQTNDIILKIDDQSVWNLTIDAVRNLLKQSTKQSNICSLTIARLCQPFI